ncbi:diguanylate cyclase [Bacillus sp. 1P02SD]|uniref:GGDEF domain-containing response regulator n=1 Tax=Bacillus sp. 1P02SD TaxID=3132264 RepID=UPI0039A3129F
MELQKYKSHLLNNINEKLSEWFGLNASEKVSNGEVYRFIHSIKGTSGTLQMDHLMLLAESLLNKMDSNSDDVWNQDELQKFLLPLIEFTYEYENQEELTYLENETTHLDAPLIQIIDDDPSMLMMLKEALEEKNWIVMAYSNPRQAVKQYFEMQPDCLILDLQLPNQNGFEVLKEIQEYNDKYFVPTIMISVQNDKQTRIEAYQKGADDFITKPIDLEEFIVKVNRHIERKKIFEQYVLIDELTQVYNRKFLNDSLPRFFQNFKRSKEPFSISIIDIDHFKKINDTYGHLMGDKVLRDFAQFLKQNIRSLDMLYRYGGEEFIIVFPNTTSEDATKKLTQLNNDFSKTIFTSEDQSFSVTFSAGVFMVTDETLAEKEAIKAADSLLYEAKRNGRARVECSQMLNTYKKDVLNVSVVDDNFIIRTLVANALESLSFENIELNIKVFEDGPSFLQSTHAHEDVNHLLILDGVMPNMDGIDVLRKVKVGKDFLRYRVIMLSGRNSKDDVKQALMLGADDYIVKPLNMADFQVRIRNMLDRLY